MLQFQTWDGCENENANGNWREKWGDKERWEEKEREREREREFFSLETVEIEGIHEAFKITETTHGHTDTFFIFILRQARPSHNAAK